jgi:hypothetical protein
MPSDSFLLVDDNCRVNSGPEVRFWEVKALFDLRIPDGLPGKAADG